MTMDFSQLHTYTPPQCAPENTGYTYSLSSSYSTSALEFEREHQIAAVYESPRMSRRSLRLQNSAGHYADESAALDSKSHGSSYSSTRRETRTLRGKKLQSASGGLSLSLSQLATPRKTLSFSAVNTPIYGSVTQESYATSDAALLASTLDHAHMRQRTVTAATASSVDGHWGRSLTADHGSPSFNGDASKSHASLHNGYICKDCSSHSPKTDSCLTRSSTSCSSSRAAEASSDALSFSSSPCTSIYSRDRTRRNKTGVLVSMSNTCVRYSKRALAPVVSLVTLLFRSVVWLRSRVTSPPGKGVFSSLSDTMTRAASFSLSRLSLMKRAMLHRAMSYRDKGYEGQAHSSFCGRMNVEGLVTEDAAHLNGSLCDDCKGKRHSKTHTVLLEHSSRRRRLAGALCSVLAYTGHCLLQPGYCVVAAGRALASAAGTVMQRLLALSWRLLVAPVTAGRGLLWFLATGWYQLASLMSVLNVFFLTRCLPILWRLLLFLLPFLLLLALWLWGPSTAALLAYLPAVNLTEWHPASAFTFLSILVPASSPVPASGPAAARETLVEQTPATPVSQGPPMLRPLALSGLDLERLEHMERRLALLWERVQQGDQKQEQYRSDILVLYNTLRERLHTQTDRESLGTWVSSLLEQRLGVMQGELVQMNVHRTRSAEQQKLQQESQETRLADVQLLLSALAVKTEELQQKQQQFKQERERKDITTAADTLSASVGVKQEDHDALLSEVQRLEAELGRIRQDLQGVMGCRGKCEQLGMLQETISTQVSSQVRKELRALFYGSESGEVPESLVLWLSRRYVSTPDLQASLASLETNILRNVSLQLDLSQTRGGAESQAKAIVKTVTSTVQHAAASEGLTEEQVKLIVQNALRIYSQDRTGLVDYALESGGGSVLSTRCSETYETKTALMSLFGLPLWYFSQSPRVVIQPDVYPGNCWAFKGSQGYLVIRLSMRILPTSFCVEHIPKAMSPTGNITSAPCNFTVLGLDDEYQEEGTLLGHYVYQEDGESLQTFPIKEKNDKPFQIIEVRVLSNWGHPEYTCIYRIRVHGEPRPR
ncbi:SUN domain-containing protein 1 [Brachionichthys hirsutus]|uniref:SUN domain-containing protein 1 n=1 Tax=Brachionichthys hirsutus TaxID=412623 RepID=UPI0036048997